MRELIEVFRADNLMRGSLLQRPATQSDSDAAEQVFLKRTGRSMPTDLREFWSVTPTLEFDGGLIWAPVAREGSYYTNGVVEEDEEWGADGFVLIGNQDDIQHFAYNAKVDSWQYLDFYDFEDANDDVHVVDHSFSSFTELAIHFMRDKISRWQATLERYSPDELQERQRRRTKFRETHDPYTGERLASAEGGEHP